jgi:hypothetical protein
MHPVSRKAGASVDVPRPRSILSTVVRFKEVHVYFEIAVILALYSKPDCGLAQVLLPSSRIQVPAHYKNIVGAHLIWEGRGAEAEVEISDPVGCREFQQVFTRIEIQRVRSGSVQQAYRFGSIDTDSSEDINVAVITNH